MRKILSVLSSTLQGGLRGGLLFLALLATTTLWAEDFSVGGIYYNYLDDNNVEVTYRGDYYNTYYNEYSGAVTIPETVTYNGTTYSVTSIGDYTFLDCFYLTSITIPNSVTSIGRGAFADTGIYNDESNWENNVLYIDNCLLCAKTSISGSYTIKENTRLIADDAFAYCSSLTSITIPNSVTSIGWLAFEYCSSLTSITIPNSVTSIGDRAFWDCSSLTSITIPNSVTSIGEGAFAGTGIYNDESNWDNNVLYIDNCLISAVRTIETAISGSYTIKENTRLIAGHAFYLCSYLTSITIPNSVTSIGDGAFYHCSRLTSITIPNGVTSIGERAFHSCSSLTSITIPNSVTSIGEYAFGDCSSLTSITIPNSVTSIGEWAFYDCSSLTSITIPNSVTSIGESAFSWCSSLTSITCEAVTPPTLGSAVFYQVSRSIPVYVPCESVNSYKAAKEWYYFTNIQGPLAEYSIQVFTSNSQMGSAKVDYNTFCEGNQISATANYGYHFAQWSDGNTDNPRSLVLTQDTVLTAEFAPNNYSISTQSNDTERGTTSGDVTTTYLDYVTISATANYGYHFSRWNDYNYDNPRQVQVTEDKTYTAYFDKNTYYITKNYDSNQGYVNGSTSGEYLDNITLTAKPNVGYHFVRWSDGNTDNPRHFILTRDTTFSAEFTQSFSGQCGDNLYWSYDETTKTISITGSGNMYDYTADTQPWLLFKEEIKEVTVSNTATSIGTSAFEGCTRLGKISLGTGLEEIAANAFAGCTRLYDIYTYATYPPFADESSFANYNVYVYIPCEYQRDYILDVVWGKFKFIECIESEETTTDGNVTVVPGANDVTITWPTEGNADTYTIVIKKGNDVFCTLTFNSEGQLLNIAFAPGRNGNHPVQYAEAVANGGYRFTVTGLEEGTDYTYDITVKDASNKTIKSHSGKFTTESLTAVENTHSQSPISNCQKLLRDGQLLILRDGVEYNAIGVRL